MGTTPEKLLDLLYNRKLPQIYREEDSKIGLPLKRYLESLVEGGYKGAVEDIEGILTLFDPQHIPESLFPFLCESFGLEYFPDIDLTYQRKFLLNLGELIKRRGTFSSVHYMIRALTGLESELSREGNTLNIVLLVRSVEQRNGIDISMAIVRNYIQTQIPYYITPNLSYRVDTQIISSKSYSHSAVGLYKFYTINQYVGGN